jgi:hypothetical protein
MPNIFSGNAEIYPTIVTSTTQNSSNVNLWSEDGSKDLSSILDKDKLSENIRVIWN